MLFQIFLLSLIQTPDPFLRKNEVPVSGIPTIRVETPYYSGPADGEEALDFQEVTKLGLWSNQDEALTKCTSSYESLLKRIQAQLRGIIVMKMEKCQLTGPYTGRRSADANASLYSFYRYEAYVSFLQAGSSSNLTELEPMAEQD